MEDQICLKLKKIVKKNLSIKHWQKDRHNMLKQGENKFITQTPSLRIQ